MHIAIYCIVIALFAGAVVLFFVLKNRKDKMRLDAFNNENDLLNKQIDIRPDYAYDKETEEMKLKPVLDDANMEDFVLEMEEEAKTPQKEEEDAPNPFSNPFQNPFSRQPSTSYIDDKFAEYEEFLRRNLKMENKDSDDVVLDDDRIVETSDEDVNKDENPFQHPRKRTPISQMPSFDPFSFAPKPKKGYAERTILPVNEQEEQKKKTAFSPSELETLANFDFDSLNGKSYSEVLEIIKDLPQKAKDIILKDISSQ